MAGLSEAQLAQRRANVKEMAKRKKSKKECKRGHSNWRVNKKDGRRICRTCHRDTQWYWKRGLPYQ